MGCKKGTAAGDSYYRLSLVLLSVTGRLSLVLSFLASSSFHERPINIEDRIREEKENLSRDKPLEASRQTWKRKKVLSDVEISPAIPLERQFLALVCLFQSSFLSHRWPM